MLIYFNLILVVPPGNFKVAKASMKVQIKSLNSVCDFFESAVEFTRFNMDALFLCVMHYLLYSSYCGSSYYFIFTLLILYSLKVAILPAKGECSQTMYGQGNRFLFLLYGSCKRYLRLPNMYNTAKVGNKNSPLSLSS